MISKNTQIVIGVLLIGLAIVTFGNQIGIWHFSILTSGWWTVLIVVPFLSDVLTKGIKVLNTAGLITGILFLLAELKVFNIFDKLIIAFPMALFILGSVFISNR